MAAPEVRVRPSTAPPPRRSLGRRPRPHKGSWPEPNSPGCGTGAFLTELERVHQSIDELTKKYGKHTVYLGSSFFAMQHGLHAALAGMQPMRQHQGLPIERKRRIFNLPFLGDVH